MPCFDLHHITCTMHLQGRTVDFKNTLIIMTSNVGSSVIEKGGGGLGFQLDTNEEDSSYNRIKTLVNEELKQYFRPEFLNRCACWPRTAASELLNKTLFTLSTICQGNDRLVEHKSCLQLRCKHPLWTYRHFLRF